jgi:hypothetical protein
MSSVNEIQQFKNKHEGNRVFLIGNGPSLQDTPMEQLNTENTIAMNNINKIYSDVSWRPTFYIYIGSSVDENIIESINLGIPCFIKNDVENNTQETLDERENVYFVKHQKVERRLDIMENIEPQDIWSDDISNQVYTYATTMFAAYQIAVYMGFSEIYLVGCDLGYQENQLPFPEVSHPKEFIYSNDGHKLKKLQKYLCKHKNIIKSSVNLLYWKVDTWQSNNQLNVSLIKEAIATSDHFTQNYSDDSPPVNINKLMRNAHKIAADICERKDVSIYNATVGGNLEQFPRVNIQSILKDSTEPIEK